MRRSQAHPLQPARTKRRTFLSWALPLLLAALVSSQARGDELTEARALVRQSQLPEALVKVEQYLAARPADAQGRFLRGLILADLRRQPEAIDVFRRLNEDHPELPEPYNNLAVLYAQQGQYEKALAALEMATRTHPAYAIAYENLGDVHARMASQAYDKALSLDASNKGARAKLTLLRGLADTSSAREAQAEQGNRSGR